ncbi:MAG: PKD domain-containing protein [Caldilineales bacterium]
MQNTPRVIRRPQTSLIIYDTPARAVFKLSQRDVSRIEQAADTSIDFLPQQELVGLCDSLGVQRQPRDDADRATLASLAAPPPPAAAAATPAKADAYAADPSSDEEESSGLRWGLIGVIIGLGVVLIAAILLLSRFFSGPSGATPTETPSVETTATVTVTPASAAVIALANVSVRSGPAVEYPVTGLLPAGASAEVIGRNAASTWWQISAPNIQGNQGWVPDDQVTTSNVANVPVATPPPLPTPTATPLQTFNGWRGEYFANADLQGQPVVVQDDPQINFNWGAGSPAPGVPPNDYSVRWTRDQAFEQGAYRFTVNVEGGVRLWLDGQLLIDSWRDQGLRLEQADSGSLSRGAHPVRVEYRKRSGNGLIAVSWQLIPEEPPVAVISGPTTGQAGQRLQFSAANSVPPPGGRITSYEWRFGDGSTASGVQVDKVYDQPASYEVLLVVTGDNGLAGTATQQVTIAPAPQPPQAVITAPSQGVVGQPLTFNGSQSSGQSPITQYLWAFDDGVAATGQVVQHAYSQPGDYTVSLTVTDSNGLTGSTTQQVQISQPPPTATPTAPPPALPLEGTVWRWEDELPGTAVTAIFESGAVRGNGGCNDYSGPYQVAGQSLTIGPLATGGVACDEGVMAQETLYLNALQGTRLRDRRHPAAPVWRRGRSDCRSLFHRSIRISKHLEPELVSTVRHRGRPVAGQRRGKRAVTVRGRGAWRRLALTSWWRRPAARAARSSWNSFRAC